MELFVLALLFAAAYGARQAAHDVGANYRERRDRWQKEAAARQAARTDKTGDKSSSKKPSTSASAAAPHAASMGIRLGAAAATGLVAATLVKRGAVEGWRKGWEEGRQRALDKAEAAGQAAATKAPVPKAAPAVKPSKKPPAPVAPAGKSAPAPAAPDDLDPPNWINPPPSTPNPPADRNGPLATVTAINRPAEETNTPMTPTQIRVDSLTSLCVWLTSTALQCDMEKDDAAVGMKRVQNLAAWLDHITAALTKLNIDPASISEIVQLREMHTRLADMYLTHARATAIASGVARTADTNAQTRHGGIQQAVNDSSVNPATESYYNPAGA